MSYAISFEDLPDIYRKSNSYPIDAYRPRRKLWDSYGIASFYLGSSLVSDSTSNDKKVENIFILVK